MAAVLVGPLLAIGACAGPPGAGRASGGNSASCAAVITIAGTTYIGGRGEGATPAPRTGTVVHGETLPCSDGNVPSRPVVAHTIPGVREADAVVGPGGYVMIAQRLWQQPWSALPHELQPYLTR